MTDRATSGSPGPNDAGSSPPVWVADSRAYGSSRSLTPTLAGDLTQALVALWIDYAGVPPGDAYTRIDGNTVTCVLVDGVADFNQAAERTSGRADYKLRAVSEVTRVTRQRVTSFLSSHDVATDVATERFTLEASLSRGAPRGGITRAR